MRGLRGRATDGLDEIVAGQVIKDAGGRGGMERVADEPRVVRRHEHDDPCSGGGLLHCADRVERRDVPGPVEVEDERGGRVAHHRLDGRLGVAGLRDDLEPPARSQTGGAARDERPRRRQPAP
jgi:hypothetical protein